MYRTRNIALEGSHSDVGEIDSPNGGQDVGGESGVLELIQQNQQVHQFLRGLWFSQLSDKVFPQGLCDLSHRGAFEDAGFELRDREIGYIIAENIKNILPQYLLLDQALTI